MLTKLYRHGPAPQSILKGYVVTGERPEGVAQRLASEQASLLRGVAARVTVRSTPRRPCAIWFETGMRWLHTAAARDAVFAELAAAVNAAALKVRQEGCLLLPNAVRQSTRGGWGPFLCEDRHRLQTSDELETATLCNLIRMHLPALIAASGRAGADPDGVEATGSRRLSDSTQHHAPHYLVAASAEHLKRVERCLRHDEGVPGLASLDVYPRVGARGPAFVEVSFNDGQALLSTARAQALLYQALLIRARRRAREGWQMPRIDQRRLQRNRARAIADGMRARLEDEPVEERAGEPNRPAPGERSFSPANLKFVQIVEQLQYELQVLEADYSELAPAVQGPTLLRLGHAALQSENDLLRLVQRQCKGKPGGFVRAVASMVCDAKGAGLPRWNEGAFPAAAGEVRRHWENFLRAPASPRGLASGGPPRPADARRTG